MVNVVGQFLGKIHNHGAGRRLANSRSKVPDALRGVVGLANENGAARLVGRFKSAGAFGAGHLNEGVFAPVDFRFDGAELLDGLRYNLLATDHGGGSLSQKRIINRVIQYARPVRKSKPRNNSFSAHRPFRLSRSSNPPGVNVVVAQHRVLARLAFSAVNPFGRA
jgi:hypothetical protein